MLSTECKTRQGKESKTEIKGNHYLYVSNYHVSNLSYSSGKFSTLLKHKQLTLCMSIH